MQKRPLKRILFFQLLVVGLFLLDACNAISPATPLSTAIPPPTMTSVGENTTVPNSPTPTIITVSVTSLPNATLEPALASPLPGWVWYESPNGVYTVAYPQQWQTGTVVGRGGIYF